MKTEPKEDRAVRLEEAIRLKRAVARSRARDRDRRDDRARISPRPRHEVPRLGEMQRSLWLQHQLEPSSAAYHLVSAFRVSGPLDLPALERSLENVAARHRLLRSTFRLEGETVVQIVHEELAVEVEHVVAGPGDAPNVAIRVARKPFDLETGPLVRLLLVEEADDGERILALVLHHVLVDERSLAQLWEEIAAEYGDGASGGGDAGLQYDDYVHWLVNRPAGERAVDLEFWRRQLDQPPGDMTLPFERRRGEGTARGRFVSRSLGNEARQRVRRVAAATGTTPFIVCAFPFQLLLQRYSEGRRVPFGTPVSTRSHPATARMIGYFLNPVVISAEVDEERSVREAIADFEGHVRQCMAHASLPFDRLVEELAPARVRDRHPIFQSMFVYQEEAPVPELGQAKLEPVNLDLGDSKFDLTLFAAESADSLEIAVEYRSDRFEEIWIEGLLGHYETLLGHLDAGLERPTAELSMLHREEREALVTMGQGPTLERSESVLLPEQILRQTRRSPRAPAVADAEGAWTYADLERCGRRVARALAACGVEPGDRVGLYLDRSRLMIGGILGIHWAGGAYVPLDPAYPAARSLDVLEDADAKAVVTRAALRSALSFGASRTVAIDALNEHDEHVDPDPKLWRPELPGYLLYTSGSTGRPKGVVVTHENLVASTAARSEVYGVRPERFLLLPSVAFDSSVAGIFWTLAEGGTLVVPSEEEVRDPRRLAQLIVEQRVTALLCVPSLYAHVLAALEGRRHGLRFVIVAGESCPPGLVGDHFRLLRETRLFNEYGPTETTVWATVHEIERPDPSAFGRAESVPIGRPIPGVRVEVLDALGRPVPAGVPGEGWISGATVAQGYWRRDDATRERFVTRNLDGGGSERAFRSGDRMVWTPDGRLLFLGRIDEQIKLRGFRVEPGEIESLLSEIPGVEEAAVVAREGARLVAFAVTSSAVDSWRERLAERLPDFMVPSRLVEVATLPRLPNGKVDRARLREMVLEPEPSADERPQVLSLREQALVSLWEGLLGRSGVTPSDNFFQLGGHSLLVVEMTAAIEQDLGVSLPPTDVFQHPTIRELAQRLDVEDDSDAPSYAHLFPIEPGGTKNPFIFSIPHFFSEMVAARFRGERPVYGLRGVGMRPEGNRGRWRTMRDLGEDLVAEITRRFPNRPVIMAGYSFGATMAVEAVRLMEERGLPVERLYLIAPMPVDFYRFGPLRVQIDDLRRPLGELSLGQILQHFLRGNHPLTRRPYRRAWRLLAIQPWRRILCLVGRIRARAGLPLTPEILYADVRVERFRLHASYRPGVVTTPTVIFNAAEPETDAAATWRPYFAGRFTVHEIPDPHLDEASIEAAKQAILEHWRDLED